MCIECYQELGVSTQEYCPRGRTLANHVGSPHEFLLLEVSPRQLNLTHDEL